MLSYPSCTGGETSAAGLAQGFAQPSELGQQSWCLDDLFSYIQSTFAFMIALESFPSPDKIVTLRCTCPCHLCPC